MLTREQIKEIIEENPLKVLFSQDEIESVIEELFIRYGTKQDNKFEQDIYINQKEEIYAQ